MSKKHTLLPISMLDELHTTGSGYDVLRYISLPELLGTQSDPLLYFMGRNLARKLEIKAMEDLYFIYEKLGWGQLELVKEKKKELVFHLMADSVAERLQASFHTEFRLEAGFLAEAVHMIKEIDCECTEEINKKIHQVEFTVIFTI
ncbi:hypothetical protein CIL05_20975 [Virgibacillus profundi]|uniref:DUF2507 domain-containing protein n=1 Tax=Virgibacillus profundi TaxID=2024555 RepID=A0A2A2I8C3_9BACI|nr:YslB family protein [Virgibacillus profundi]PAV27638.1 hypothetical protein CIL05_20975 [Virgibacillus profundi]PXY51816.1 DUF2507 domain-containing protein [Virgibacillus profundi]